mmetsp:Transcript_35093/g.48855  ORF Transcript_35093/g.48855 Transcript_35093/m.48855 type:complete len:95 (-) Transcript_35093:677-961(-)
MPRLEVRRRRRVAAEGSLEGGSVRGEQERLELLKREYAQRQQRFSQAQSKALLPIVTIWGLYVVCSHGIFSKAMIPVIIMASIALAYIFKNSPK